MNITRPTVIQRKGIPHMIEGRDVLIRSKTGTGKTLTYLLPIVQHLTIFPLKVLPIIYHLTVSLLIVLPIMYHLTISSLR